ncbi:hypothetical protein BJV85_000452 [Clostridium acetobutylicum]|uniref:DUF2935 domain-containing protein n=1 Tax=Clostridium acetobutylicum (strain ATCC 824 / DSM 792 / JCM 1419 / IAM 19013 / LMG 5710 / NBRC 13948 / NRRL B-527 / VKM B-1787 / 2291 / W) TaxID=272562 RepID=Q97DM3_CLOAB|nr:MULTISPECIES: DUF2935 domain-containing protein [Clostridium]AAK81380.1 Hypothetical protein CA_C3450 [Clostridium acetobutylicum ATCC 824]ADZ22491.1 Conserved hypothetical protein [Clostridium acetobutylicum EA 2018]AEI32854.1 hypothetical protein SMB_G3488 [Clostridium acetobutylicum DSM 1731]AWV80954.1 DUF2935 domain-containing protein [Clostridium acetobutylicum]MBC2393724.1 DUF2935 domain-containing protein [Clostridium acetobutylicum]
MISNEQYVRLSLELNLFFLRIVKEHNVIAGASLPPKYAPTLMEILAVNKKLDMLLSKTVALSKGNISREAMNSSTLITPLTLPSEKVTSALTGVPINTAITSKEISLGYRDYYRTGINMVTAVSILNKAILPLVNFVINFQAGLLSKIMSCKAFSYTYPSNIDHVIREARAYVNMLNMLERKQEMDTTPQGIIRQEIFWNDIMEDHAEFIRGYLDPSQTSLFNTANNFVRRFDDIENATESLTNNPSNLNNITRNIYSLVTEFRNFKSTATKGLLACKIKAIMAPLLADHVTREANYYLRLLRSFTS